MATHAYSLQIWTPSSTRLPYNLNQSCGRRRCIINMGSGYTLCVGDSPAPGPRREPAQLMVVPFIGQGHLGSDEQDLPTGRGTRVSLRWTRQVMRCSPPRVDDVRAAETQKVCTLRVCEGHITSPPTLN